MRPRDDVIVRRVTERRETLNHLPGHAGSSQQWDDVLSILGERGETVNVSPRRAVLDQLVVAKAGREERQLRGRVLGGRVSGRR